MRHLRLGTLAVALVGAAAWGAPADARPAAKQVKRIRVVGVAAPAKGAPTAKIVKGAKSAKGAPAAPGAKAAAPRGYRLAPRTDPKKHGAFARVAFAHGGALQPAREAPPGHRGEPTTAEEAVAAQIQKLLRGPLRRGVTGLYVADARTGAPLFAVNADEGLNPASNVKMISTAAALELLGPEFRYPTRVLGPAPIDGVVRGDIYLLGSHDPTLTAADLDDVARTMAARGITAIRGNIVVGSDATRDGIYRAVVPIEIAAGEPGAPPTVTAPAGLELVTIDVKAKTSARAHRPRLTYKAEVVTTETGQPRVHLTVSGTIGKGGETTYALWTRQRTATAAYSLIAALRARAITVGGAMRVAELGDFVGDTIASGALPVELGRHDSRPVADIVAAINKWSINWLSDRLIMTAAGLVRRQAPSMELALDAMYGWLARRPHVGKDGVVIDTGSGLSYRTQITPHDLVSVVRSAGGFVPDADPKLAEAWRRSLSVVGTDGTLRHRFRGTDLRGRILGKSGTLSTVIAMSGILDIDPDRPLAFALVTNTDAPLPKPFVRKAHEKVVHELCKYLARTAARPTVVVPAPITAADEPELELEETTGADDALDTETANSK